MAESTEQTQLLIDRAGSGDGRARQQLLEHYRDYLRRMVAPRLDRRLAPRVDPSDIVQETLAEAAVRLDDYLIRRPLPFFGWLRQLAGERISHAHRRHLATGRRSVARESRIPEMNDESAVLLVNTLVANDTSPSNRLLHDERVNQVLAALAAMSASHREVLIMRHFELLSTAEIADAQGITEAAAKSRLVRAVIRMREILEANP